MPSQTKGNNKYCAYNITVPDWSHDDDPAEYLCMNVSLGTKWERFVDSKVENGDFQTASEVLREGLRLLEERDLLKRISVSSLDELRQKLLQGIESLDRGKGIEGEQAFRRLRNRRKGGKARA